MPTPVPRPFGEPDPPLPESMTPAEELRAIADSIRMVAPFQASRLHVIAAQVDGMDRNNAVRRACATGGATTVTPSAAAAVE